MDRPPSSLAHTDPGGNRWIRCRNPPRLWVTGLDLPEPLSIFFGVVVARHSERCQFLTKKTKNAFNAWPQPTDSPNSPGRDTALCFARRTAAPGSKNWGSKPRFSGALAEPNQKLITSPTSARACSKRNAMGDLPLVYDVGALASSNRPRGSLLIHSSV